MGVSHDKITPSIAVPTGEADRMRTMVHSTANIAALGLSRSGTSHGLPHGVFTLADFPDDRPLKAHPDYRAAKAGDADAAARLVIDLVKPENLQHAKAHWSPDTYFAPAYAEEASGPNAIPLALALHYAAATGGQVAAGFVQVNHAYHTGAKAMERLMTRAEFVGNVRPGASYVLVDDVTTLGSTLADLAACIQTQGGVVVGVALLVNAARLGTLDANPRVIEQLEARHGDRIRETLGVSASQLTGPEAQYLLGFRSADDIRGRAAKASAERSARLHAKEILPERQDRVGEA